MSARYPTPANLVAIANENHLDTLTDEMYGELVDTVGENSARVIWAEALALMENE